MKIILIFLLAVGLHAIAHDEGHGPKLTDAPKIPGGVLAPVVLEKEAGLGTRAAMKHKAEIVRAKDGTVSVYFYDEKEGKVVPLTVTELGPKASGVLISGKKGKFTQQKFDLEWKKDHFEGKMPKPIRKPYNIDVKVMEGATELLVAFDNLD